MNLAIEITLLVGTILCILANGFEVGAKLMRARFMVENASAVGVGPQWIPYLAGVEGAGTIGVAIGAVGVPVLGLTAALGLTAYFAAAVTLHIRKRVFYNIVYPVLFLILGVWAALYFAVAA